MINRDRYWKCEYENLRRKKNKEIVQMKERQRVFADKTWRLLKLLGMPEQEILDYYRKETNDDKRDIHSIATDKGSTLFKDTG